MLSNGGSQIFIAFVPLASHYYNISVSTHRIHDYNAGHHMYLSAVGNPVISDYTYSSSAC